MASEAGSAVAYGLYNSQERGVLFIGPGTEVYEGMIVGENARSGDITVNVCKRKQLTNTRASGSDDALRLVPPLVLSLESLLEFLVDDELLEVTPHSLRLRKTILEKTSRERASRNKTDILTAKHSSPLRRLMMPNEQRGHFLLFKTPVPRCGIPVRKLQWFHL